MSLFCLLCRAFAKPLWTTLTVAVVMAMAAAGCEQVSWQRPATDASTADADRTECQRIARNQAARLNEIPFLVPYFVTARDDHGRVRSIPVVPFQQFGPPVWWPNAPSLAMDQQMLKYDLFRDCMEAKGYALLPEEAESGEGSVGSTEPATDGEQTAQPADDESPPTQAPSVPEAPEGPEGQEMQR